MLSSHIAFELDKNAIFLRNQDLNLHHSKMFEIRKRKNNYLNTSKGFERQTRLSKQLPEVKYSVSRDNHYLNWKIKAISTRNNMTLAKNNMFVNFINKNKVAQKGINALKKKNLHELNTKYYSRLTTTNSVIDNKKIEEDFRDTRKVYKYLRRIQPNQSAATVFNSYTSSPRRCGSSSRSRSKKNLPPLRF